VILNITFSWHLWQLKILIILTFGSWWMRNFTAKEGQINQCPWRQDTTELFYPHIVFCCVLLCCVPLFYCCSCSKHVLQCTATLRSRSLLSGIQKHIGFIFCHLQIVLSYVNIRYTVCKFCRTCVQFHLRTEWDPLSKHQLLSK
jgi:hypothetical protein